MYVLVHVIGEALSSIRREQRRLVPMALGIVWGMACVMVLLALASGFEDGQRRTLMAYGDRFLLLRLNRGELDRAASGAVERRLQMDALDVERLRAGAPAIVRLSPVNNAHRVRITGPSGAGSEIIVSGVLPELREIRTLVLESGRFLDELDEEARRRVIVLGPQVKQQLFGDRRAVGQKVRVAGFAVSSVPERPQPETVQEKAKRRERRIYTSFASRDDDDEDVKGIMGEVFEVIGVLKEVESRPESYVSLAKTCLIPFSTACAVFDRDFSTMYLEPRTIEDRDLALKQFRQVMGDRYGFAEDDANAVVIYFDAIGRARTIAAVFGGIRIFLSAVGAMILSIGAIGVMNVILVSLAARRYEIGLRKAIGATPFVISVQFFAETVIACLSSGLLGFLLGIALIGLLGEAPLPEGFSRPRLDSTVGWYSFVLLALVAVLTGIYPARRAARLEPVVALRSRE